MTRSRDIADQQKNLGGAVAPFAAGKNKIINGDFGVWQRGTSFTPSAGTWIYTADRWATVGPAGTTTSRQSFTIGTAPVAGYEGTYYLNQTITANAQNYEIVQRIEDARTFANQTVTLSFWARSTVGAQPLNAALYQNFGSGGTPSSLVSVGLYTYTPTSSWQRFTFTFSVPSIAGKTFGTNNDSYLWVRVAQYTTTATNTSIDIWGVQLEAGSVATSFQTASGSIGGELALCQRYYERSYNLDMATGTASTLGNGAVGNITTTTAGNNVAGNVAGINLCPFKATKRVAPTMVTYDYDGTANAVRVYPADQKKTGVTGVANIQTSGAFQFISFSATPNGVATNGNMMFHWTADAEI